MCGGSLRLERVACAAPFMVVASGFANALRVCSLASDASDPFDPSSAGLAAASDARVLERRRWRAMYDGYTKAEKSLEGRARWDGNNRRLGSNGTSRFGKVQCLAAKSKRRAGRIQWMSSSELIGSKEAKETMETRGKRGR